MSISGNYHCPHWTHYPIDESGAAGALLGETPIICAGRCFKITAKKADLFATMAVARWYAGSVTINSDTLWISGGFHAGKEHSSSDFIQLNGITQGPDLPIALSDHAMVNMNSDITIIIGGITTL